MSEITNVFSLQTKAEHEQSLANDPIPSLFRRYAIPSMIGMLAIGIQSIIDGIIVGNLLGANALAGVSLVLPLYSFVAAIAIVIGVGSQTLVSVGQGTGNYDMARNSMTTGFRAILALGLIATVSALVFSEEIVSFLGGNSVVESYSVDYIRGLFPFMILIGCAFYNDYMLRVMGHPRTSMYLMTLSVVLNVGLNILFVTVCEWGTFGVGFATGLAFTVSAIISMSLLQYRESAIKLFGGKFRPRLLWNMFYNGSSEGVSELASGITIFLFNVTLMKYLGESGVAAFTVINYIYFVGVIIFVGVSDGLIPIISYNFGAKQYGRSKAVFRMAVFVNASIGVVTALILVVLGPLIIEAFIDGDERNVIAIASTGARIYAFAFLINGFNILCASFFTAVTDAKRSVIISALRGVVFIAIGVTVIPEVFGIEYVWYAVPIAELLTLGVSMTLIWRLFKKWSVIK